jgi:hypothetical protein
MLSLLMGTEEQSPWIDGSGPDDDTMRRLIQQAFDDPRPSIPAEEVFERLRRRHAERMKTKDADRPSR